MRSLSRFLSGGPLGSRAAVLITQIEQNLRNALEMAHSVDESASQLMLETDPSNRQPRSWYVLRYQSFADTQIEQALELVTLAERQMGETAWQQALKESKGLALLIADSKLVRDQIQASMKEAKAREAANEIICPD